MDWYIQVYDNWINGDRNRLDFKREFIGKLARLGNEIMIARTFVD